MSRFNPHYALGELDFDGEGGVDLQHMDAAASNPGEFAGRMHARAALVRDKYAPYVADKYARMQTGLSSMTAAPAVYFGNPDVGNMKWDCLSNMQMPDFSSFDVMGAFSDPYATPHYKYAQRDDSVHHRNERQLQCENDPLHCENDPYYHSPWAGCML